MLKLLVKDTTVANPVLPVSWCISEDLKERFRKEGMVSAYLLIMAIKTPRDTICYGWNIEEVERMLVPLSQGLVYIRFNQPGEHLLCASVIVPHSFYQNGGRQLERHFFPSDNRGEKYAGRSVFKTKISKDDVFQGSFLSLDIPGDIMDYTIEKVVVAEKFFASEPSQWEKNWVLFFPRALCIPIRNQCHYRAWRIIAYSIQPILFLIWYTITGLIVVLFLSLGFWREVNIRKSLFSGNLGEYFSYEDKLNHNFFLKNKEHKRRNSLWFFFSPAYLVFGAITLGTIADLQAEKPLYLAPVVIASLMLFVLSSGILFLAGLMDGIKKMGDWTRIRQLMALKLALESPKASGKVERQEALRLERLKLEREKDERQKKEKAQRMIKSLEETVCKNRPVPIAPSDLPLNLRTIHLHAESIKAKVCKQFAKQ